MTIKALRFPISVPAPFGVAGRSKGGPASTVRGGPWEEARNGGKRREEGRVMSTCWVALEG